MHSQSNKNSDLPLAVIGLPVYNDGKYLEKLLESIVQQDYPNIIVCISDNNSTDNTEEICRQYFDSYSHIKYIRNERTIGAPSNLKKIYDYVSQYEPRYFLFTKSAAIMSHNLVSECVRVLEENNSAVLAFPTPQWVDEQGNIMNSRSIGYYDSRGFDITNRVILSIWGTAVPVLSLVRYKQLKHVSFDMEVIGHDYIVLLELAMLGSFAHARNSYYQRIYKYSDELFKDRMQRYKNRIFLGMNFFDRNFPFITLPYHMMGSVFRSRIPMKKKILILLAILVNAPLKFITKYNKSI